MASEPRKYNLDEVTLTLDADMLQEWTVRDINDLELHSGLTMPEWGTVMVEGRVPTRALRAWCWVENRRRWPEFPMSAVDEIPYGKFLDLAVGDRPVEDEDTPLAEEGAEIS